ncbi:hypothetical protein [Plantactinospora soyae]|uniref:SCO6045-like C-terminal domain-containing protein n=1 Tax=Plantactinospora soyae TaxID=1544732 RepID=A0A927MCU6_9ACTN|nr:hypothetical protein [Plantactinospora soyae]MBE1492114.1 hypothetical protein [Plantactinospora soyae]
MTGGTPAPAPDPTPLVTGHTGTLADRQAALVATLVAGAPVPPGFDVRLVGAARSALLGKRAGDVARSWPLLAAGLGERWPAVFARWAATRPTQGSLRDGWDLARELAGEGPLPTPAAEELAVREVRWRYDGTAAPRRRGLPAVHRLGGVTVLQIAGRIRLWSRRDR